MPAHFFNSELSYSKSKPQTWRPEGQKEPITIQRHIAAPQFNVRPLVSKVVGHKLIFEQHFLKSLFARLLFTIGVVWKLKKFLCFGFLVSLFKGVCRSKIEPHKKTRTGLCGFATEACYQKIGPPLPISQQPDLICLHQTRRPETCRDCRIVERNV